MAKSEIRNVINLLDQRIRRLQEARAILQEEWFGEVDVVIGNPPFANPSQETTENGNGNKVARSGRGRKAQLEKFLKEHGPSLRAEVVKGSGVPDGTLGYLIGKYPHTFVRTGDGRWALKGQI